MQIQVKTVSPLEKVFCRPDLNAKEMTRLSGLRGEIVSFQIAVQADFRADASCRVCSERELEIRVRETGLVPCTIPAMREDPFVLTSLPGLFPDPLLPIENGWIYLSPYNWHSFWISVRIPEDAAPGEEILKMEVNIRDFYHPERILSRQMSLPLEIVPERLPEQKLKNINWFYADCIMTRYKVECWSPEHWELLGKYFRNMAEHGNNILLTPLWTVPLDTGVGRERPTVQLLEISLENGVYHFDFSRLAKWIALAKECGIQMFEMSHAFTQWGAKFTPKIMVKVDGREEKRFGWHVAADSPEYAKFLRALMAELIPFLKEQGLEKKCYFHVSDEPTLEDLESYRKAMALMKSAVGEFPILDALSRIEFLEQGISEYPVPGTPEIDTFMKASPKERWVYYAGFWENGLPNRQFGMPSIRNRIMGTLLYLYHLDGFLHWGYNFWYTAHCQDLEIDPYLVTDAGRKFCGGGSFMVYPGKNGPVDSLHFEVFRDGLQDLRAMRCLEEKIGRDAVVALIHEGLSYPISMPRYPHDAEWLLEMRTRINRHLAK